MPSDPLRSKALACLREGRVTVFGVKLDDGWRPIAVLARVRSSRDRHPYRVVLRDGVWSCTCRAGLRDEPCPHVAAVALVTTAEAAA
jgi:uncharacterized Zn finger protein